MVNTRPRHQVYAQCAGVLSGAVCGSIAYLVLVGDLHHLQTLWKDPEWAMPAVVQWKAVAELFQNGIESLPTATGGAMICGALFGMLFAILEKEVPSKIKPFIPSPTAVGLAFVIPAYYSISMAVGGVLSWLFIKKYTQWSHRFLIVLAAGLIAGDSLTGVGIAIWDMVIHRF
jgi:uncharacterized oligopeptide transporter (OPT) family protein